MRLSSKTITNNMPEQWIKWKLVDEPAHIYYLDSITDNMKGFTMCMLDESDRSRGIKIMFGDSVDSYRSTYESFRQRDMYEIRKKYGDGFLNNNSFFKVTNSSYLKWLSEQSYGITDELGLMHFVFFTLDFVVDVVATEEPKVELVNVHFVEK